MDAIAQSSRQVAAEQDPLRLARRIFLQRVAGGVALPAAAALLGDEALAHAPGAPYARGQAPELLGRRQIIRDFADPYLELMRLLRQASEIEHALMVQYLYAAFSVKPAYQTIVGNGAPGSQDLIGISAMEMQHLRDVNALLAALGGVPHLYRQDYPFQPETYPFPFNLEPLSRASLAKYVFCEAASGVLDVRKAGSIADLTFLGSLDRVLHVRPNHVGSLYDAIIHTLGEYIETAPEHAPLTRWIGELKRIKTEGEEGHFQFFKRVFLGTHDAFGGDIDVWSLPLADAAYPALPLPVNPSAFVGHENQVQDPASLGLAWLGNLHYWLILLLAQFSYSEQRKDYSGLAQAQMMGPFWAIARQLPRLGIGMPFEPLAAGYAPCRTASGAIRFIRAMLGETKRVAASLEKKLPADYPLGMTDVVLDILAEEQAKLARLGR